MGTSRYVPLFPPAPTKDQNRGKVLVELIEKTKKKKKLKSVKCWKIAEEEKLPKETCNKNVITSWVKLKYLRIE